MLNSYDVVIVGSGVAGLYAALQFTPDVKVLMIAKKELLLSNSALAQGGVAAVLDLNDDDFRLHIADTLIAGGYENDLDAVRVLVTEGRTTCAKLCSSALTLTRMKTVSRLKRLKAVTPAEELFTTKTRRALKWCRSFFLKYSKSLTLIF